MGKEQAFLIEKNEEQKEQVNFFEILKARCEDAPIMEKIETMTVEDVAKREGVEAMQLEEHMRGLIQSFAEEMKDTCTYGGDEYYQLLDAVYSLYLQSKDSKVAKKYSWLEKMNSFDEFCEYFSPEATSHARIFMKLNIQVFIENRVHPQRKATGHGEGSRWRQFGRNDIYSADGDWVLLPERISNADYADYTEEDIVREIIELIKDGYKEPDYSHTSGSAVLDGISKHKAILSSREAKDRGEEMRTGEIVTTRGSSGGQGLGSVYADYGSPRFGYQIMNWFDEFHLSFGIDKQKQDEFMETTDVRFGLNNDKLSHELFGSEGVLIGHVVPLDSVKYAYCWHTYKKDVEKWVKKNCPHVKVISVEASDVLSGYGNLVNSMALQEGIKPEEAWERLLENKKTANR